mgnify:CR=1 FL=1
MDEQKENVNREAQILSEIRNSEAESQKIIGSATREKESIIENAKKSSLQNIVKKKEEITSLMEKNISDFKSKTNSIRESKLKDGKKAAAEIKSKAESSKTS